MDEFLVNLLERIQQFIIDLILKIIEEQIVTPIQDKINEVIEEMENSGSGYYDKLSPNLQIIADLLMEFGFDDTNPPTAEEIIMIIEAKLDEIKEELIIIALDFMYKVLEDFVNELFGAFDFNLFMDMFLLLTDIYTTITSGIGLFNSVFEKSLNKYVDWIMLAIATVEFGISLFLTISQIMDMIEVLEEKGYI